MSRLARIEELLSELFRPGCKGPRLLWPADARRPPKPVVLL